MPDRLNGDPTQSRSVEAAGVAPASVKTSLLIIEDDDNISTAIEQYFSRAGFTVNTAADGIAGIEAAAKNRPDVVVLDLMLPKMDGLAVCKELRSCGQRMPILMLTARDGVEDRIEGLDQGADDYLTKPFEFRELLARLRALLRRPTSLQPARLVVADLIVDTTGQTVSRGGKTIPMTAKEYALVEFLARNANRVVGRAEIAEHVWNEEFDPFSNLIEVYIGRLRRIVDRDREVKLIHTIRGSGYILEPRDPANSPVG